MAEESCRAPWDIIPEDEAGRTDRRVLRIIMIVLSAAVILGVLLLVALLLGLFDWWTTTPQRARYERFIFGMMVAGLVLTGVFAGFPFLKSRIGNIMERKCGEAAVFFVAREGKRHMRGRGTVLVRREGLEIHGRIGAPGVQAMTMGGGGFIVGSMARLLDMEPFLVTIATAAGALISYLVWRHSTSLFVPCEDVKCISCNGPYVTLMFSEPPGRDLEYVSFYVNSSLRREFFAAVDAVFPGMLPSAYREALAAAR